MDFEAEDFIISLTERMDKYTDLVDTITVDIATRVIIKGKENIHQHESEGLYGRTASRDKGKRNEQIEAMIEIISELKKCKQSVSNSKVDDIDHELVLNSEKVSSGRNFVKVGKVLGTGNSSGDVILVRDKVTGHDLAYKTIMLYQFHGDEIRAWVNLGDDRMAPELYHFRLNGNKVEFSMECLPGQTLEMVIDSGKLMNQTDLKMAADFSLCVLDDLLGILEKLSVKKLTHGDMHAGNVMLENSMKIKVIDFGSARNLVFLNSVGSIQTIKRDIIGIIRIFCALYSGVDFNSLDDARKQLEASSLSELSANMVHLPEASRIELFRIMSMLFDTVRDPRQEGFGDTSQVAAHVKTLLPADIPELKKRVAVILFPEKYQKQNDENSQIGQTCCDGVDSDYIPIWDDPDMDDFVKNVTLKDIQILDSINFF